MDIDLEPYMKEYAESGIVSIPNFLSSSILDQVSFNISPSGVEMNGLEPLLCASSIRKDIKEELDNYKWWGYAIRPYDVSGSSYISTEPFSEEIYRENIVHLESNLFCYRFRRSYGKHYDTCECISCRLERIVSSSPIMDTICQIVGCSKIDPAEIFLSNYGKGDFLSIHHDIGKGDISATFSLTEDWNPAWGGLLHFCDESRNIYKTISPQFGSLNLFRLDSEKGLDHFVSPVAVNKNRYTLTAWYNI